MTVSKHTDDLETLAQEREKAKQQLSYWTQREKILSHQMAQLTPKERTHRLCTRAGMLESFLKRPELLTDDQVMELLKVAFRQTEVQQTLTGMLKEYGLEEG